MSEQGLSRKSKGFTLVELLVVIGIIALLIAILLPLLNKVRAASMRTACQSNVRQLYIGILNYTNDNHDWYPTSAYPADGVGYVQFPDDWLYWQRVRTSPPGATIDDSPIAKYLNTRGEGLKRVVTCPADFAEGRKAFPGSLPSEGPYLYSYGLNEGVGANLDPSSGQTARTKRGQWRRPTEKILFTEDLEQLPLHYAQAIWSYSAYLTRRHGQGVSAKTGEVMGRNVTAVFMDGHVATIDEDFSRDIRQNAPAP